MKDPAILFYTSDFLTGTMTMDFEDRGKYIYLLCTMHQHGRLAEKTIWFLVGSVSDNLRAKFKVDENGLWYNERLENEAQKRAGFTASRRSNGKMGGRPKNHMDNLQDNHMHNHMDNHMENENENINIDKGKGVQGEGAPLNATEIQQTIEYIFITVQRKLSSAQVTRYWDAYLIHSTGTYHHGRNRQLQHFRNWLKLQPNEKATKPRIAKNDYAGYLSASRNQDLGDTTIGEVFNVPR